jgi:hypothetical protein
MAGGEYAQSFWFYFGSLLKREVEVSVEKNEERMPRDIALYQSVSIALACTSYYHVVAINAKERKQAFAEVEKKMEEAPYFFTLDEMFDLKGRGKQLLADYSKNELQDFLKEKLKPEENGKMPKILLIRGRNGETWYVKKLSVFLLCDYLINIVHTTLRSQFEQRWLEMLKEYHEEAAMRDNFAFEELITELVEQKTPHALPLLRDPKVDFAQEELRESVQGEKVKFVFHNGEPLPLQILLGIERESLLNIIRAELPFWYSINFVVKLIGFMKYGTKREIVSKKNDKQKKATPEKKQNDGVSIDAIAKSLVPQGKTIDTQLNELADKWNQIIDKATAKKARDQIDSIIKSQLRFMQQTINMNHVTLPVLEDSAKSIVETNDVLKKLQAKKALADYVLLSMVKMLKHR